MKYLGDGTQIQTEFLHASCISYIHTMQAILYSFGYGSSQEIIHGIFHTWLYAGPQKVPVLEAF